MILHCIHYSRVKLFRIQSSRLHRNSSKTYIYNDSHYAKRQHPHVSLPQINPSHLSKHQSSSDNSSADTIRCKTGSSVGLIRAGRVVGGRSAVVIGVVVVAGGCRGAVGSAGCGAADDGGGELAGVGGASGLDSDAGDDGRGRRGYVAGGGEATGVEDVVNV